MIVASAAGHIAGDPVIRRNPKRVLLSGGNYGDYFKPNKPYNSEGLNYFLKHGSEKYYNTSGELTSPQIIPIKNLDWISNETGVDFNAICWSPELKIFVGLVYGDKAYTSTDGSTWTIQASSFSHNWTSIAWSPIYGVFAAVADGGEVMTSPDGINWTNRVNLSEVNAWQSICWSGGSAQTFVAVGSGPLHYVMTSPDGVNWNSRTPAEANSWQSVCWGPEIIPLGLIVAVSSDGTNRVMVSQDGINWFSYSASEANYWIAVCWSAELGLFVAVSTGGTHQIMTSPDGTAWSNQIAPVANQWSDICWSSGLGLLVSVSDTGTDNRIMFSRNGTDWEIFASFEAASILECICWSQFLGIFVSLGFTGFGNAWIGQLAIDDPTALYVYPDNVLSIGNFEQLFDPSSGLEIDFAVDNLSTAEILNYPNKYPPNFFSDSFNRSNKHFQIRGFNNGN